MIRRGLLLLLLLGAPAARATLPLLESGCTLTPVVQPATPAPPPAPGPGGRRFSCPSASQELLTVGMMWKTRNWTRLMEQ